MSVGRTTRLTMVLVLGLAAGGCGDDSSPTDDAATDDGGRDESGADADADADADDAPVEDVAAEDAADSPDGHVDPPCGAHNCPNDPTDGPIGVACMEDPDCAPGIRCIAEEVEVYERESYIRWNGGYCMIEGIGTVAGCDPANPGTCPDGSACFFTETDSLGNDLYACLDLCSDASDDGVPWYDNCDCRDGYQCRLDRSICWPGCSHDRECCESWRDGDGGPLDGNRQAGEVTHLPVTECINSCDPCTYACVNEGCPGGACDMMSPCEHDSDCPAMGVCLDEYTSGLPGGMCTQVGCDRVGRECPPDAGCANVNTPTAPLWQCLRRCTPGTEPGDPDFACRDAGTAGVPDAGDYACIPWPPDGWFDGTTEDGICFPGNFPGGTTPLSGPCVADTDCVSPAGLGLCYAVDSPPSCTVYCTRGMAEAGFCDEAAGGTAGAGAYVLDSLCVATCDHPGADLGSATTGCPQDGLACVPVSGLDPGVVIVATGAPIPVGFCWPACRDDTACTATWGGGTCNVATGVCE